MNYFYMGLILLSMLNEWKKKGGVSKEKKDAYADLFKTMAPMIGMFLSGNQKRTWEQLEPSLTMEGGLIDIVRELVD